MCDRPVRHDDDSVPTSEMIERGFEVLLNYGITDRTEDAVRDVYRAMVSIDPARAGRLSEK